LLYLKRLTAIGDVWLKLPGVYASRIYPNLRQKWIVPAKFKEYSTRILTPPYISNIPDVYHHVLPDSPCFILLASDGLMSASQYSDMDPRETAGRWIQIAGQALDLDRSSNGALSLLRDVLGGDDTQMVSRNLTVEMDERWMDDTTILIQRIGFD
jgi:pyruvate dehydrogenase phosphatase